MIDGLSVAVMIGIGEAYLPAFVLAMDRRAAVSAGLVASVPLLVGTVIQLRLSALVRWLGSVRKTVVLTAVIQALSFLPLAAFALAGSVPVVTVFAVAAVYWAAGMACSAAWQTWAAMFVPRRVRSKFFAQRTRLVQAGILGGVIGGGLLLRMYGGPGGKGGAGVPPAFACMFFIACIGRLVSARMLASQTETATLPDDHRDVRIVEIIKRLRHGRDARLIAYLLLAQAAVQTAHPFFHPFVLGTLRLSENYPLYVIVLAAPFVARMVSLPIWGRYAHRAGAHRLMWIGGIGIVPLSAAWMVSDSVWYLLGVQLFAGVMWAAFELSSFLLLLETIPQHERTSVMSIFNMANAAAMAAGSMAGAALLHRLGTDHTAYLWVFGISLVLRAATVGLLARLHPPTRDPGRALTPKLPAGIALNDPVVPVVAE